MRRKKKVLGGSPSVSGIGDERVTSKRKNPISGRKGCGAFSFPNSPGRSAAIQKLSRKDEKPGSLGLLEKGES